MCLDGVARLAEAHLACRIGCWYAGDGNLTEIMQTICMFQHSSCYREYFRHLLLRQKLRMV